MPAPRDEPPYDNAIQGYGDHENWADAADDATARATIWDAIRVASPTVRVSFMRALRYGPGGGRDPVQPVATAMPDQPLPPADGPGPRYTFAWRGRVIDMSGCKLRYDLLRHLWNAAAGQPHEERDVAPILMALWHFTRADRRLSDLCYQIRCDFLRAGIDLTIASAHGKIWLAETA